MARALRRIWWARWWVPGVVLVAVLVGPLLFPIGADGNLTRIGFMLLFLPLWLDVFLVRSPRPPLPGSFGRTGRRSRFWDLTTAERLEAIDAVKRGDPPCDRDQARVFMEMVDPGLEVIGNRTGHPEAEVILAVAAGLGGVVAFWAGDGFLGTFLLLSALIYGFTSSKRRRVAGQRAAVVAAALPFLNRSRRRP
jgi:hypothetical protein